MICKDVLMSHFKKKRREENRLASVYLSKNKLGEDEPETPEVVDIS